MAGSNANAHKENPVSTSLFSIINVETAHTITGSAAATSLRLPLEKFAPEIVWETSFGSLMPSDHLVPFDAKKLLGPYKSLPVSHT
jgi:hypothetical protein